jgi:hypothetical protein
VNAAAGASCRMDGAAASSGAACAGAAAGRAGADANVGGVVGAGGGLAGGAGGFCFNASRGGIGAAARGAEGAIGARCAPPDDCAAPCGANSCAAPGDGATVITPPQTAHRARTDEAGILDGSTRNTDRHSGQVTFTTGLPRARSWAIRRFASRRLAGCRCGDRSSRPILGGSLRSSSFRLRVR